MAQWALQSPAFVCALEGKVAASLGLHGELDILTDTALVVHEPLQLPWTMTSDHKYVTEITKPAERRGPLGLMPSPWNNARTQVNDKGRI